MSTTTTVVAASPSAAPAWVSYAALLVSIAALVVSTSWGWWSWRRNGELVRVGGDLRAPFLQGARYRPVHSGQPPGAVTLTVRNIGRSDVTVHRVLMASPKRTVRSTFQPTGSSASIPVLIKARDRARWYIDQGTLGVWTKQRGNPLVMRPLVEYGPGKWKAGPVLRIRVSNDDLPGAGQPFRSTLSYRLRTLRRRKGTGPFTFTAHDPTVTVSPPSSTDDESS